MKIQFMKLVGSWRDVADAARTTVGRAAGAGEPSVEWKRRILLCEHSPIRKISIGWKWLLLPYWVSVHFVRHKFGIEHWVSTQRSDRTGEDRTAKTQDAAVSHECLANAQAMIFISRRRLCRQAAPETRAAWKKTIDAVAELDPALASCCVPECIYRGFCPEFKSCGYVRTEEYRVALDTYRNRNVKEN